MRNKLILIGLTIFIITSLLVAGCAGSVNNELETNNDTVINNQPNVTEQPSTETVEQYLRTNSQGSVIVDVLWSPPDLYINTGNEDYLSEYELTEYHVFDLGLTTHSGDLRDYSYLDNAVMLVDGKEIKPVKEDVLSNDSHHPAVLVKFPLTDDQGNNILTAETLTLELILRDLRDIPERKFTWQLPL